MDPTKEKEQFNNDNINPNLEAIKPKIKTFLYKDPLEIYPDFPPDKFLYPEQYKFYDYDINKVREDMTKPAYLAGIYNILFY